MIFLSKQVCMLEVSGQVPATSNGTYTRRDTDLLHFKHPLEWVMEHRSVPNQKRDDSHLLRSNSA
jgi:hypothetical protein